MAATNRLVSQEGLPENYHPKRGVELLTNSEILKTFQIQNYDHLPLKPHLEKPFKLFF